jgi:hypothetical protein
VEKAELKMIQETVSDNASEIFQILEDVGFYANEPTNAEDNELFLQQLLFIQALLLTIIRPRNASREVDSL